MRVQPAQQRTLALVACRLQLVPEAVHLCTGRATRLVVTCVLLLAHLFLPATHVQQQAYLLVDLGEDIGVQLLQCALQLLPV